MRFLVDLLRLVIDENLNMFRFDFSLSIDIAGPKERTEGADSGEARL